MGRAGRPQFDRHGVAVIMVHEPKKQFYKRFLYEPFPVESSLQDQVGGGSGVKGRWGLCPRPTCNFTASCPFPLCRGQHQGHPPYPHQYDFDS